jgi:hypothetical protein
VCCSYEQSHLHCVFANDACQCNVWRMCLFKGDGKPGHVRSISFHGTLSSEVAALDVADDEPQTGAIVVRARKGNKNRRVYAPSGTIAALDAWLEVRGLVAGALFGRAVRGGRVGERLADAGWRLSCTIRQRQLAWLLSHHTTCAAPASPSSSTPAPTWRQSKRWLAMRA